MHLRDLSRLDTYRDLAKLDRDDLLEAVGLQTRRTAVDYALPGLVVFGAGLALGCGLGLLLAPRPGAELREELGQAFNRGLEQGKQQLDQVKQRVSGPPARPS